jgi:RNA polymerase sigma-70 factor (ECF subfamily)
MDQTARADIREHMSTDASASLDWVLAALQEYEGRLLRYALRLLKDADRAEDVVQETFLKLCREDPAQLNGRLGQWLYTVCRNHALDICRKESRMAVLDQDPHELAVGVQQKPAIQVAEELDEHRRILRAMETLSANQQECIRLKFQHDFSYREIAQVTGLTVTNVGFQIHAGLKRIREILRVDTAHP